MTDYEKQALPHSWYKIEETYPICGMTETPKLNEHASCPYCESVTIADGYCYSCDRYIIAQSTPDERNEQDKYV